MKTSLQRIYTSDGIELVGLLYEPEQKTGTIVVHVHGMAGNFYENRFLDSMARTFTDNNVAFFSFNNRGCETVKDLTTIVDGKRAIARLGNAYERFEDCVFDIQAAVGAVASWGFGEIHLQGHSLGCAKVLYYATQSPHSYLASLILLSPSDMHGLVRNNRERFSRDIEEARMKVASGAGADFLSRKVWDEFQISAATYLSIFDDTSKAGILHFYAADDPCSVMATVSVPLLAVMGRKDDALVISIEATMARIKQALTKSPRVETVILGDADHGYKGDENALAQAVYSWLRTYAKN